MPDSSLQMAMTETLYSATTGQNRFQPFLFAGHAVDNGTPLAGLDARNQRRRHAAVDTERHVGDGLHQFDGPDHQFRFGLLRLDAGDADIDVENVGAGLNLGQGVALDAAEVARFHLGGQLLAAGGVDALADEDEGLIRADDDGLCG